MAGVKFKALSTDLLCDHFFYHSSKSDPIYNCVSCTVEMFQTSHNRLNVLQNVPYYIL